MENRSGASFDRFSGKYESEVDKSIAFLGVGHDFFTASKARHLLNVVQRRLGDPRTLSALDVGCGTGLTDALLAGRFRSLSGADLSAPLLAEAAARNPSVEYRHYEGENLPYADGSFDVVFAICVVHHVPPANWARFLQDLKRVVRPGGLVLVFEHNPWNPLTRLAVSRCALDDDAVLLTSSKARALFGEAGLEVVDREHILLLPFDARPVRLLERCLSRVPLGAQYFVAGRK